MLTTQSLHRAKNNGGPARYLGRDEARATARPDLDLTQDY